MSPPLISSAVLILALSLALIVLCSALLPRAVPSAARNVRTEAVDVLVKRKGAAAAGVLPPRLATDVGAATALPNRTASDTGKTATSLQSAEAPAAGKSGEQSPLPATRRNADFVNADGNFENLLARRNADFENADGKNDWSGWCGNPRVSRDVAHSGNASLLFPSANKKQAMFCAPKLNLPHTLWCGQEYRLSMWVTTDASWVRKSRPKSAIGHHSHFMLMIKANGVQKTCNFKSEEFLFVCAQSVNLATGGRWIKLDGLFQFGYGVGDPKSPKGVSNLPPANPKQIGNGPSFHVDGIDQDASVYIDDVRLVRTGRIQSRESHDAAWGYAKSKARQQWGQPPNQLVDVPKEDVFPRSNLTYAFRQ